MRPRDVPEGAEGDDVTEALAVLQFFRDRLRVKHKTIVILKHIQRAGSTHTYSDITADTEGLAARTPIVILQQIQRGLAARTPIVILQHIQRAWQHAHL